jgi:hypothetical protein
MLVLHRGHCGCDDVQLSDMVQMHAASQFSIPYSSRAKACLSSMPKLHHGLPQTHPQSRICCTRMPKPASHAQQQHAGQMPHSHWPPKLDGTTECRMQVADLGFCWCEYGLGFVASLLEPASSLVKPRLRDGPKIQRYSRPPSPLPPTPNTHSPNTHPKHTPNRFHGRS